jgi:hypothetical protein
MSDAVENLKRQLQALPVKDHFAFRKWVRDTWNEPYADPEYYKAACNYNAERDAA